MWRPRDHERFIGGYDPEHEMPDPDRRPRGRYESDAYRYNARDSRYPYHWNPDRFEERFRDRDDRREWELRWNRDARNREYRVREYYSRPDYDPGYDRGYDRYDFDRTWSGRNRGYYEGVFGRGDWRGEEERREFRDRDRGRDWRDRQRWDRDDYEEEWDPWRSRNRRW